MNLHPDATIDDITIDIFLIKTHCQSSKDTSMAGLTSQLGSPWLFELLLGLQLSW
jgi:hypothetical protein